MTAALSIRWGLGRSIAASLCGHLLLVGAGWMSWNWSRSVAGTPIDIAVDFQVAAGGAHAQVAQRSKLLPAQSSPLDEALAPAKKEPRVADVPALMQGKGGEAAQSGGASGTAWDLYRTRLRDRIHEELQYPRISKNLGESGQVRVRFTVLRDGTIQNIAVAEPSAFERLNLAAVATVKRVARLDPLPADYARERWDAFVPIQFILK